MIRAKKHWQLRATSRIVFRMLKNKPEGRVDELGSKSISIELTLKSRT